jgi:hypothetical protein
VKFKVIDTLQQFTKMQEFRLLPLVEVAVLQAHGDNIGFAEGDEMAQCHGQIERSG